MVDSVVHSLWRLKDTLYFNKYELCEQYAWYYAEREVYLLKDMTNDTITIVEARSPIEALFKIKKF